MFYFINVKKMVEVRKFYKAQNFEVSLLVLLNCTYIRSKRLFNVKIYKFHL
jgi:hypothetical protein